MASLSLFPPPFSRCVVLTSEYITFLSLWKNLFKIGFIKYVRVLIKGNQSWIFIGRADAEAETPILWLPDAKSWLIWKDPDAGKDWGQENGTTEDEMDGITSMDVGLGGLQELVMDREALSDPPFHFSLSLFWSIKLPVFVSSV